MNEEISWGKLLKNVRIGETTTIDIAGGTDNRKVTVEARRLHAEPPRVPTRAESPRRAHTFHDAAGFASYLERFGGGVSAESVALTVFADVQAGAMHAVLDDDATHGKEIVTFQPQEHPLWKPWREAGGKTLPLDQFSKLVLAHRRSIKRPAGRDLAFVVSQLRASVFVEIQRGRGKDAVNGIVTTTKIQGQDKKDIIELPDEIELAVPLYSGTKERAIELDLCVEATKEGQITVLVTEGTVAEARVKAFEEMLEVVRKGISGIEGALVVLGSPYHEPWTYLPENVS